MLAALCVFHPAQSLLHILAYQLPLTIAVNPMNSIRCSNLHLLPFVGSCVLVEQHHTKYQLAYRVRASLRHTNLFSYRILKHLSHL